MFKRVVSLVLLMTALLGTGYLTECYGGLIDGTAFSLYNSGIGSGEKILQVCNDKNNVYIITNNGKFYYSGNNCTNFNEIKVAPGVTKVNCLFQKDETFLGTDKGLYTGSISPDGTNNFKLSEKTDPYSISSIFISDLIPDFYYLGTDKGLYEYYFKSDKNMVQAEGSKEMLAPFKNITAAQEKDSLVTYMYVCDNKDLWVGKFDAKYIFTKTNFSSSTTNDTPTCVLPVTDDNSNKLFVGGVKNLYISENFNCTQFAGANPPISNITDLKTDDNYLLVSSSSNGLNYYNRGAYGTLNHITAKDVGLSSDNINDIDIFATNPMKLILANDTYVAKNILFMNNSLVDINKNKVPIKFLASAKSSSPGSKFYCAAGNYGLFFSDSPDKFLSTADGAVHYQSFPGEINCMAADENGGNIYLGTGDGLKKIKRVEVKKGTTKIITYPVTDINVDSPKLDMSITSIFFDSDSSKLYFSAWYTDSNVNELFSAKSDLTSFTKEDIQFPNSDLTQPISALYVDSSNAVAGFSNGNYGVKSEGKWLPASSLPGSAGIKDILVDGSELYIGTINGFYWGTKKTNTKPVNSADIYDVKQYLKGFTGEVSQGFSMAKWIDAGVQKKILFLCLRHWETFDIESDTENIPGGLAVFPSDQLPLTKDSDFRTYYENDGLGSFNINTSMVTDSDTVIIGTDNGIAEAQLKIK